MKTKQITINFGLVASPSFPAVARARVLTDSTPQPVRTGRLADVYREVWQSLAAIGCTDMYCDYARDNREPTAVIKCEYPWQAEIDACAAPSVLKYEPYMRLYELAAFFAQDCVAVLPNGEQGLLVGARAAEWGAFDSTKFITLD